MEKNLSVDHKNNVMSRAENVIATVNGKAVGVKDITEVSQMPLKSVAFYPCTTFEPFLLIYRILSHSMRNNIFYKKSSQELKKFILKSYITTQKKK